MKTLALVAAMVVSAVQLPARPEGRVNDLAGVMSAAARQQVETALAAAEARTSNQIVVVTLPSLEGEDIADVGYRIGRTWGIGQQGRDNGVVLVVAVAERKLRIEVGKGLEGALTDLESRVIIDEVIRPELVAGRYDSAIARGTQAIVQAVDGEFQGPGPRAVPTEGSAPRRGIPFGALIGLGLLVLLFFISPRTGMLVLGSMMMMGGRRGGGGRSGGFSGGGGSFGGGGASGSW